MPLAAACIRQYSAIVVRAVLVSLSPLRCPSSRQIHASSQGHPCDSEGEAINTSQQISETLGADTLIKHEPANWYAVQTRARKEKVVCEGLQEHGLYTFLPLVTEVRRWSDRKKKVELPLFSCYVFVKLVASNNAERMRVYRTNGVFRIVRMRGGANP